MASSWSMFRVFMAIQMKDYKKGQALIDTILETHEKNANALTYKGILHMEQNEDEKAIEAFSKALKIEPRNVPVVRNRAIVNLRAGHLKEAKEDYELLLSAMPKSHVIYYGLGDIAYQKKDKEEAVKNYDLYLKFAPKESRGELQEERKKVEARLKELRTASK